jgi:hypothetical protein
MTSKRWPRLMLCLLGLSTLGCTALREVPRSQYAAMPERKNVRLLTSENLAYEFDYINVEGDTLVGYRQRDASGAVEDYAEVRIPLEGVASLSVRSVSWYRTGLVGGGVIAALVVRGLTNTNDEAEPPPGGGGSKDPIP